MKAFLKLWALLVPVLIFSQADTTKVSAEARQIVKDVIVAKKSLDSIQKLKEREIRKQMKLIAMIKSAVAELNGLSIPPKYVMQERNDTVHINSIAQNNKVAVKDELSDVPYYVEEVPRKGFGRFVTGDSIRIRVYRYDEDGNKIYIK